MSVELEKFWIFRKDTKIILEVSMETKSSVSFERTPMEQKIFNKFFEMAQTRRKKNKVCTYDAGWAKYSCYFFFDDEVNVLYQSSKLKKDKAILQICKMIEKMFSDMYTIADIQNWDGTTDFFKPLEKKLKLYFKMANL